MDKARTLMVSLANIARNFGDHQRLGPKSSTLFCYLDAGIETNNPCVYKVDVLTNHSLQLRVQGVKGSNLDYQVTLSDFWSWFDEDRAMKVLTPLVTKGKFLSEDQVDSVKVTEYLN